MGEQISSMVGCDCFRFLGMAHKCRDQRLFLSKYLPPTMMGWMLLIAFIWLANPHNLIIQCDTSKIKVAVYTGTGVDALYAVGRNVRPMTRVAGHHIETLLTRDGFDVQEIDEHTLPDALPKVAVLVFPGGSEADYEAA